MQYTLTLAMVLSAISAVVAQGTLLVNTPPNFIVCTPASISFSGGQAPYILSVIPGGQVSAAALETFPTQAAAGAYTWNVDLPAGTSVTIQIRDATGVLNYSAMSTILAGTTTSCIGASSSSGAAASTPAGGAAATSARTSAAATTPPTSAAVTSVAASTTPATTPATSAMSTAVAATTASSAAAAASTSAKSGASALSYGYNALALVGAAVLAVAA